MDIVDFAYQIIKMDRRIEQLELENADLRKYKEKYTNLLDCSIQHNNTMMGNLLDVCLMPGVIEAIGNNNAKVKE
jgi:hypothetical protein